LPSSVGPDASEQLTVILAALEMAHATTASDPTVKILRNVFIYSSRPLCA
jgi:hypothetical protein